MSNFAIIENDIVVNVVVSETALAGNWVESDTAAIGDKYIDGEFIKPEPLPTSDPVADKRITKLAFKQRLTQTERIAIRATAQSNPMVYDFQDLVDSATFVDLSRQDTIDGLRALESAGLLEEGRVDQILMAPITELEQFKG